MVVDVKRFLAPPVFKDEADTRTAALLNVILLTFIASNAIHFIVLSMTTPTPWTRLLAITVIWLVWIGLRWMMRQGRIHWVSLTLVSVTWLLVTLFAVIIDGVHADPFNLYIVCICMAGLLLKGWWGMGFVAISVGARLILLWAASNDTLFPNTLLSTALPLWLSELFTFAVVAVLLHFAANNLKALLTRARHSEQAIQSLDAQLADHDVAIQQSELFNQAILNSLTAHIAVLDKDGVIIAVNQAWKRFAEENGAEPASRTGVGTNYLAVCRAVETRAPALMDAQAAATGIAAILAGEQTYFTLEYPCHSPTAQRWFALYAAPLALKRGGAVVVHINITARKQMEEALCQSEARYRFLFEAVPNLIWTTDATGKREYANPKLLEFLGLTTEQALQGDWTALVHPEDRLRSQTAWQISLKTGAPYESEERTRAADGSYPWFLVRAVPMCDDHGQVRQWFGIATNIDQQKRVELALRQSEERYRQLVEVSPYPIFINRQNRVVYANAACLRLFGASAPEQLVGKGVLDLIHPNYHALVRQRIADYLNHGQSAPQVEEQFMRLDGASVDVEVVSAPIYDEKELAYLVIARDITRWKQADTALRQSEARNRALLAAIPDAMVRVRRDGLNLELRVPKDFSLIRPVEQMIGRDVQDIFPPALANQIMHYCHQALETQQLQAFEFAVSIHGEIRTREARVAPASADEVIAIIRDITERKRAEEKKFQLLNDIEQQRVQVAALNQRLAETQENERKVLAHELHDRAGQSLTALGINLNILKMQLASQSPNVDRMQARLNEALALTTEITEQIRDVMADLRPPVLDKFGLLAALQWYATRMTQRIGLPIVVQGEEPTPRLAEQIELTLFRVAQEALTNVSKHAQATQATITLLAADGLVRLTIADNGRGFEPTQLEKVGARQTWGLLTIRERLEAIRGVYQLASHPGAGTILMIEVKQ